MVALVAPPALATGRTLHALGTLPVSSDSLSEAGTWGCGVGRSAGRARSALAGQAAGAAGPAISRRLRHSLGNQHALRFPAMSGYNNS